MATRALRIAASGMYAQNLNIEVISNNIANINTTGFKKNKAEFQDLMYQEVPTSSVTKTNNSTSGTSDGVIQLGTGVKTTSTQKIFVQGDLEETSNELDMAIKGEGFFQVTKPDGSFAYTRDGSFELDSEGNVVTSSGYLLEPAITLDDDNITEVRVGTDGTVEAVLNDGETYVVDNIELVRFVNPGGLTALGDNLYAESTSSGDPIYGTPGEDGFGEIYQGYLESSNVDIVEEMVSMINAQHAYEINSKTVKTVEEMLSITNNLKQS